MECMCKCFGFVEGIWIHVFTINLVNYLTEFPIYAFLLALRVIPMHATGKPDIE